MGRAHGQEEEGNEQQREKKQNGANSSRAAAVAAAVALYLFEGDRKSMVISYAAIEAILALSREHTTLADIKHIGAFLASAMPLA